MTRWGMLLALLWAPALAAQTPPAQGAIDRDDLTAFVDGFVEARMQAHHVVGATVSVVHGGEMIFAKGYGHADLEADEPVRADRTLFRIGSTSKTFTWTAVMQLYEQGKLDLDADIRTYLPDALEIAGNFDEPITMKHLMAHTPGFEDTALGHLFGNDPDRVPERIEYLERYRPVQVRPPGTLPAYSNYGVALAGLAVANVSGLPFETYAERHLFEPLGMQWSTFREPWAAEEPAPMPEGLQQAMSRGYARKAGGFEEGRFSFIGQVGPAGAMSSTATDMARWMRAHLNHGRLGEARILEAETARLMHSQHFTLDPQMPGMAHGFIESRLHGYRGIGHGGNTIFFHTDMQLVPELGLGVFISTNTTTGPRVVSGFVRTLVERYFPPGPLAPGEGVTGEPARPLSEYAGTYVSTRRPYTTVERLILTSGAAVSPSPDGYLVLAAPGRQVRLEPLGGDLFRAEEGGLVKFTSNEAGDIDAMLPSAAIQVLEKVGPLGNPQVLYGLLALSAFIMACAVIGAWLRRKRPIPQSAAEAWAARLIILTAVVWLAVYVVGVVGLLPLLDEMQSGFLTFPSPTFVASLALALAGAVLTVLSALLLYTVWSTGSWPVWRRLRHTVVVLAAVVTLLVLRNFNAIGFNYLAG